VMLCVIYIVAVHVATFAMSRFRLPLTVPLAVGAALALVPAPPGSLATGSRRRRGRWPAGRRINLVLCWGARFPDLYASRSFSPVAEELPADD
jgi:hypothetical protein